MAPIVYLLNTDNRSVFPSVVNVTRSEVGRPISIVIKFLILFYTEAIEPVSAQRCGTLATYKFVLGAKIAKTFS